MTDLDCPFSVVPGPIPPGLDRLFGYTGDAQYVAFFWEPAGDEVVFCDGQWVGTGRSRLFMAYRSHPVVNPHLAPYQLGCSELRAEEWLILDRQRERLHVASREEARAFLDTQHLPEPELTSWEEIEIDAQNEEFLDSGWQEVPVDLEEVKRIFEADRTDLQWLLGWLDRCPRRRTEPKP